MEIKFKKLVPEAEIPQYAYDGDIGLDVKCTSVEYDIDHDTYIYHTGLACESDVEIALFGFTRSSNCNTDAYLTNSVGIIDPATYRGEIQFRYKNRDSLKMHILESIVMESFNNNYDSFTFNKRYLEITNYYIEHALDLAPYKVGERVGQFVPKHVEKFDIIEVDELSETIRGANGFGSTGK